MPFIPHTDEETRAMLDSIGVNSIDDLFDEIPAELFNNNLDNVPAGITEMEISRLMQQRAAQDGSPLCFIGAGAYEHHIPAAIWEITTRGEFYSAYTPYQAEASQGTLQLLYEFQTMMTQLTALDVSNASMYDGASALAEAVLMAVRANRKSKSKRILIPRTMHPIYRKVTNTIVKNQNIVIEELDYQDQQGITDISALPESPGDFTALVIPQPNFFGNLEEVDALTNWAHKHNALVIAVVNPTSLAILRPPGEWGDSGADIACGEGQPLGIPLSSGGPYFGFMCCKQAFVRQMPGRIIGKTVDLQGKPGYTLTLQAREQHIRRSKATSNICTNQGLMTTAATIYLALLGANGLAAVATQSHHNTQELLTQLTAIEGVETMFEQAHFHEAVLRLPKPAKQVIDLLAENDISPGYDLSQEYPELQNCILVCATETKTDTDINSFAQALQSALS